MSDGELPCGGLVWQEAMITRMGGQRSRITATRHNPSIPPGKSFACISRQFRLGDGRDPLALVRAIVVPHVHNASSYDGQINQDRGPGAPMGEQETAR